ncbi:hypothetical protein HDV62DRAFT_45867 [Trichoderma sp. SZMC 28011]
MQGKGRVLNYCYVGLAIYFCYFFFHFEVNTSLGLIYLFIRSSCLLFLFPGFVPILFKRVLSSLFLFTFFSFCSPGQGIVAFLSPLSITLFFLAWILLCLILCFLVFSTVQVATIAY